MDAKWEKELTNLVPRKASIDDPETRKPAEQLVDLLRSMLKKYPSNRPQPTRSPRPSLVCRGQEAGHGSLKTDGQIWTMSHIGELFYGGFLQELICGSSKSMGFK
jgi:hypothetical protein